MGFRVQIFGRRCALEPAFFFIKRQYTEQLTDKQGEQFWAVSTCQKHYSSHRSLMHSIFAICLFTSMVWIAFKPLAIAFAVGYLSHILLDLTNRKNVQLFFPIKRGLCFGWFPSSGRANDIIVSIGHTLSGCLIFFYILRARVIYHDGTELITSLNKKVIGGINVFQCYLIIVNIVSIIIFTSIFTYSMERYEETEGRQGIYFWFFELLCFIGGGIGIFFSLIRNNQYLGKRLATMYVYALSMIEAWGILYMIVINPFRHTLTAIQNMDLSLHLRILVYVAVVNIVLLLIVWIDRDKRHTKWSKIETVEVLLGLAGGSFLLTFVDLFYNFRGNNVFGWAFSTLCATHFFAIGYLLCCGLI